MGTKVTEESLKSNPFLREHLLERAVDRTLVAIRLTGIPASAAKALRTSALDVASDILDDFDFSIFKNPTINNLREALMNIYERFLLWMRTTGESLGFAFEYYRDELEEKMVKINELLNVVYMLNEPELPDDALVRDLLRPGSTALVDYWKTLEELESIMPSPQPKKIPERGRTPSRTVLTRQGYEASPVSLRTGSRPKRFEASYLQNIVDPRQQNLGGPPSLPAGRLWLAELSPPRV